jgi:hypothetical protein
VTLYTRVVIAVNRRAAHALRVAGKWKNGGAVRQGGHRAGDRVWSDVSTTTATDMSAQHPQLSQVIGLPLDARIAEYSEAVSMYRFYHEYRMQILNYTITLNAALLVFSGEFVSNALVLRLTAAFAVMATAVLLALELRTVGFANAMWDVVEELEGKLDLTAMSTLRRWSRRGVPQRYWVWALYTTIGAIWAVLVVALT